MASEFRTPMELVRLTVICLNETYSNIRISKHLSDTFRIQQGDPFIVIDFAFTLEHVIRKLKGKHVGLNWHTSFLSMLLMIIYWGEHINTITRNMSSIKR
jgi:hypothetical protein